MFAVNLNNFQLITVPPFQLILDVVRFQSLLKGSTRRCMERGTPKRLAASHCLTDFTPEL